MQNLLRVQSELSLPEWQPSMINYKLLKKKIKAITRQAELMEVPTRPTTPAELSHSANEVEFFKLMEAELKKGSRFFENVEQQFGMRTRALEDSLLYTKFVLDNQQLGLHRGFSDEFAAEMWTDLMRACVNVYRELLLLHHWIVMSYW